MSLESAWALATPEGREFVDAHFTEQEQMRKEWQAAGGKQGSGAWEWYQARTRAEWERGHRELQEIIGEAPEERERREQRELRELKDAQNRAEAMRRLKAGE